MMDPDGSYYLDLMSIIGPSINAFFFVSPHLLWARRQSTQDLSDKKQEIFVFLLHNLDRGDIGGYSAKIISPYVLYCTHPKKKNLAPLPPPSPISRITQISLHPVRGGVQLQIKTITSVLRHLIFRDRDHRIDLIDDIRPGAISFFFGRYSLAGGISSRCPWYFISLESVTFHFDGISSFASMESQIFPCRFEVLCDGRLTSAMRSSDFSKLKCIVFFLVYCCRRFATCLFETLHALSQ